MDWEGFVKECKNCTRCGLSNNRQNVVIGRGVPKPCPVLFVGEGPGEQEDIQGEAFVGRAGKLLDILLTALDFNPEHYYIANVVKCRPPDNRIPTWEEMEACLPWLRYQVKFIKPFIIVCLGATAAKAIIDRDAKITQIRGQWVEKGGFLMFPTYHPAAVLRDIRKREDFYLDMKNVKEKLESISGQVHKNT
ncbi:MAG: uracil-DNA glycosylase [Clostridiaceae bacterium]|nr:uracil-DNA glycosylase [Clostridiaceae bacterium]